MVVIIHGWSIMNEQIEESYMGTTRETVKMPNWVFLLQDRILAVDDVNVIVHDWRGGAHHGYRKTGHRIHTINSLVVLKRC